MLDARLFEVRVEGGKALARAIAADGGSVGRRFLPYSPFGFAPGEVTDDTQMTLTALAALRGERPDVATEAGRRLYVERVGGAYRAWLRGGPRDVGATVRAALIKTSSAGGWQAWAGGDAAGNGSLMRATAPYCAGYRADQLVAAAVTDCAITHPDPRVVAACLWYAATLEAATEISDPACLPEAMRSGLATLRSAVVEGLLEPLAVEAPTAWAAFRERWPGARAEVTHVVHEAMAGEHVDCLEAHWTKWPTGFVLDSLRQAAWAALQGDTPDEPLRLAVLHGGRDADTIGAIAGGLIGARFGIAAGERWSANLLGAVTLAERLPGVSPGPILEIVRGLMATGGPVDLDWRVVGPGHRPPRCTRVTQS